MMENDRTPHKTTLTITVESRYAFEADKIMRLIIKKLSSSDTRRKKQGHKETPELAARP